MDYFDQQEAKNEMKYIIYASCKGSQLSSDAGEGKGSVWTNHFIANGIMVPTAGYEFTALDKDGKVMKQTTQSIKIIIKQFE